MSPGVVRDTLPELAAGLSETNQNVALLQQRVSQGMESVSSQLASMHAELRELTRVSEKVAVQQQSMESHSEGLERAFRAIKELADKTSGGFEAERTARAAVRDQVVMWRGVILGFGAAAMLLLSAGVYIVQNGFDEATQGRLRLEILIRDLDNRVDRIEVQRRQGP